MNQQTYGKLKALRLSGMADAYKEIAMDQRMNGLTAEELITLMVDREETRRHHNTRERLLKKAGFEQPSAHISEIDYSEGRMLDRSVILNMASCHFIWTAEISSLWERQEVERVILPAPSALKRVNNFTRYGLHGCIPC